MLSLEKKEFQHFILQYILSNLEILDILMEGDEGGKPLKEQDFAWADVMRFIQRRSVENRIRQRWPLFEPRIKSLGKNMAEEIMSWESSEDTGDRKTKRIRIII